MGAALSTRKGRESKSGPTSGVVNPQHASTRHSDVHVDLNDPEVSSAVREYAARVSRYTEADERDGFDVTRTPRGSTRTSASSEWRRDTR